MGRQYPHVLLWRRYDFTRDRGPLGKWQTKHKSWSSSSWCLSVDCPCTSWQLRHVVAASCWRTISRIFSITCRSPGFIFVIAFGASSTCRSRKRLSPATKLFANGCPVLRDIPLRMWHWPQMDATTRGGSTRIFERCTRRVSLVCPSSTVP